MDEVKIKPGMSTYMEYIPQHRGIDRQKPTEISQELKIFTQNIYILNENIKKDLRDLKYKSKS